MLLKGKVWVRILLCILCSLPYPQRETATFSSVSSLGTASAHLLSTVIGGVGTQIPLLFLHLSFSPSAFPVLVYTFHSTASSHSHYLISSFCPLLIAATPTLGFYKSFLHCILSKYLIMLSALTKTSLLPTHTVCAFLNKNRLFLLKDLCLRYTVTETVTESWRPFAVSI